MAVWQSDSRHAGSSCIWGVPHPGRHPVASVLTPCPSLPHTPQPEDEVTPERIIALADEVETRVQVRAEQGAHLGSEEAGWILGGAARVLARVRYPRGWDGPGTTGPLQPALPAPAPAHRARIREHEWELVQPYAFVAHSPRPLHYERCVILPCIFSTPPSRPRPRAPVRPRRAACPPGRCCPCPTPWRTRAPPTTTDTVRGGRRGRAT